jgi:hypothetical protein
VFHFVSTRKVQHTGNEFAVKSLACIVSRTISVTAAQAVVLTPVLILLIELVLLKKLRLRNPRGFKSPAGALMQKAMLAVIYLRDIRQSSNRPYITTITGEWHHVFNNPSFKYFKVQ